MDRGFVSFFSGALGLDLGLERVGLIPLSMNEVNKSAIETIRQNRPSAPLFDCDIRLLTLKKLRKVVKYRPFAVVGGPPCQAFSTAGRRKGLSDNRGNVFLHFLNLATALEPQFIVIENVRGLLSAKTSPLEKPGSALATILQTLESQGFGVSFQLYNVANFGVPQLRERLVLIASADGKRVSHLSPTHPPSDWQTFRNAVDGLSEIGGCALLRKGREKYFQMLSEGENWRSLPLELQEEALGGAFRSSGGRVGFCRRLAWDRPAPTLVTNPTMPATELVHPVEMRPLSISEYLRIQTFPDDWKVCGSLADRYRQIGNAVPVKFAECIGQHLLTLNDKKEMLKNSEINMSRYHNTCERTWNNAKLK